MTDKSKVRSVVARFFGVSEASVTDGFVFSRERLHGSVGRATFHAAIKRMAGADLPAALSAGTFGELFEETPVLVKIGGPAPAESANLEAMPPPVSALTTDPGIGVDIEHCDNLPAVADPSTDAFYVENFTPAEIAYCQRQPDPRESFCGLWCVKEAAKKCGGDFFNLLPLEMEINHDVQGRPFITSLRAVKPAVKLNCQVSISHSHGLSTAVCVAGLDGNKILNPARVDTLPQPVTSGRNVLGWLALSLGVLNLLLWMLLVLKK